MTAGEARARDEREFGCDDDERWDERDEEAAERAALDDYYEALAASMEAER